VDDLVAISLNAATQQWEGIYNAVSPQAVSQKAFTKTLAKAMQRPYFMPSLPQFLIRLVMGEMSILVFNSQNVSATKVLQKGYQFKYPELLTAIKSLL
jgi:NAD dependent epimerase/dehydratase family enzyme